MRKLITTTKMLICAFLAYPDGKMVKSVLAERVIDADMVAIIQEITKTYKDNGPISVTIPDSELAAEKELLSPYTRKIIIPCSCNSGITTIAGTTKHGLLLYVGDAFINTLDIKDVTNVLNAHFGNLDEYLYKADKYNWK